MGASAFRTCLVVGEAKRLLERDETATVEIAADPIEIQRLVVDGKPVLVWLPPNGEITIRDHPCFFWSINSDWHDPWFLPSPIARCREADGKCPPFFSAVGPPGPVEDGTCESPELRCIEGAAVRLYAADKGTLEAVVDDYGEPRTLRAEPGHAPTAYLDPITPPGSCLLPRLTIGEETVWLALHAGARWLVTLGSDNQIRAKAYELHTAARDGETEKLALLLDWKYDPNAKNVWGATALQLASGEGRLEVVRLLLEHGADPNARSLSGSTSLHWASSATMVSNQPELVGLLLKAGADANARDENGGTPLHRVVDLSTEDCRDFPDGEVVGYEEDTEMAAGIAERLLASKADVHAADQAGLTPLHVAAKAGNLRLVRLVLRHGAKRDAKDGEGRTPKQLAEAGQYDEVVEALRRSKP